MSDKTASSFLPGTGRRLKLMVGGLILILAAGFLVMRVTRTLHDRALTREAIQAASAPQPPLPRATTGPTWDSGNSCRLKRSVSESGCVGVGRCAAVKRTLQTGTIEHPVASPPFDATPQYKL